jgi:hypothetical protein
MQFAAYATTREPVDGLYVQRATLGGTHRFRVASGEVELRLPPVEAAETSDAERRVSLVKDPDNAEHTWFEPAYLSIRLDLDEPVTFAGSEDHFNGIEVVRSKSASRTFDQVQASLAEALDRWKRTLRWVGLAPEICFSEIGTSSDATRGRGFKVFRASDDALFRGHGGSLTMPGGGEITTAAWEQVGIALAGDESPPLWMDYLMTAWRLYRVGDLRTAAVNAAISCETALRALFASTLPTIASPVAIKILDNVSVQQLLTKVNELAKWTKQECKAHQQSAVHELFDLRNAIMHSGLNEPDTLATVAGLLPKVTRFVLAVDQSLSAASGQPPVLRPGADAKRRITTAE